MNQVILPGNSFKQSQKPQIFLNGRQSSEIVKDLNNLLLNCNDVYRYGSAYAHIVDGNSKDYMECLNKEQLQNFLINEADYFKYKGDVPSGDVKPAHLDTKWVNLVYKNNRFLPEIKGVISHPILRQDGELVYRSGYDPVSKYLLRDIGFNNDSEIPSLNDAFYILADVFGDFDFKKDADYANFIALLLQPIIRPYINSTTPLFGIEAPTEGSGKGYLVQTFSNILFDEAPHMKTLPETEESTRKVITSTLKEAKPLIVFDNCEKVNGKSLNAVITSETWSDRNLGYSENITVPNQSTWVITGNNPVLSAEIARRCVTIRLVPWDESPSQRKGYRHPNLVSYVKQNRLKILQALVSIVRHWIDKGMPEGNSSFGSFEDWEMKMRGILECAGVPGFLANRDTRSMINDSDRLPMKALCRNWFAKFGSQHVSASEIVKLCEEHGLFYEITAHSKDKAKVTAMGMKLMKMVEKVYAGHILLTREDTHKGRHLYYLVPKEEYAKNAFDPFSICGNSK